MNPFSYKVKPLEWVKDGECIRCTSHIAGGTGYPYFRRNKISMSIARHILARRCGHLAGKVVRHTCDHKWCINPAHIIIGSHADNMRDASERGLMPRGDRHPAAKLTERCAREIKASNENYRLLALRYGIAPLTINDIRRGRRWKHISGQCSKFPK